MPVSGWCRLQDARRTSAVAIDIATQKRRRERAASFGAATAVWDTFYGNAAAHVLAKMNPGEPALTDTPFSDS
jgi:hypothetical protein